MCRVVMYRYVSSSRPSMHEEYRVPKCVCYESDVHPESCEYAELCCSRYVNISRYEFRADRNVQLSDVRTFRLCE